MLSRTIEKRLRHEVDAALARTDKRGQSKHRAKQTARAQAQREQRPYRQIEGLYAPSSISTYRKQALTALRWIAEAYGCKHLSDCRPYLPAYFAEMEQKWSQRMAECRNSSVSVSRWCTEHEINPKTYYNWQRKVFVAMMERQKTPIVQPEELARRFAELPAPQTGHDLAAAMQFDRATLEVYSGASAEVVMALCKVLSHAQ